jgi:HEAT repeat protein
MINRLILGASEIANLIRKGYTFNEVAGVLRGEKGLKGGGINEDIEHLLAGLNSENILIQIEAAEKLGKLGAQLGARTEEIINALHRALVSKNEYLRNSAGTALLTLVRNVDDKYKNKVVDYLYSFETETFMFSKALGQLLSNLKDKEIALLLTKLNDKDKYHRIQATIMLGNFGAQLIRRRDDVVDKLLKGVFDSSYRVHKYSVEALSNLWEPLDIKQDEILAVFFRYLKNEDKKKRIAAVSGLGKLASHLTTKADEIISNLMLSLRHENLDVRAAAINALVKFGPQLGAREEELINILLDNLVDVNLENMRF